MQSTCRYRYLLYIWYILLTVLISWFVFSFKHTVAHAYARREIRLYCVVCNMMHHVLEIPPSLGNRHPNDDRRCFRRVFWLILPVVNRMPGNYDRGRALTMLFECILMWGSWRCVWRELCRRRCHVFVLPAAGK